MTPSASRNVSHAARHGLLLLLVGLLLVPLLAFSAASPRPVERDYPHYPPAPAGQHPEDAEWKSAGCMSCHTATDSKTMHSNPAVVLGCVDCHGGDAMVFNEAGLGRDDSGYLDLMEQAHVMPLYPDEWGWPKSRNPIRTYTLINRESPEFVRFKNPSDYRVAMEACGACHMEIVQAAKRSIMATTAMLWGGAAYNNGILPYKNYILGEAYTRDGVGALIQGPPLDDPERAMREFGILPQLAPLPAWETVKPGDIFRVFERGGRNIINLFPETGVPNVLGLIQRLEEPGRPDIRQSNRGPGTGQRISVPLINITKTRLNDPLMWFLGTNDQPGDFRTSGCAACHVPYANDRDPRHSGPWAKYGHMGESASADPTIPRDTPGHPVRHEFTRAIPSSQCMSCHMHQPNVFVNSYLGYTMWDYESDAPRMWPEEQRYPTSSEIRAINARNPEGAAPRGKWGDLDFLRSVWERNEEMEHTQFADYHGHGWNFRAIYKRDRKGNLLDAKGEIVPFDDPDRFDKSVHMADIHLDVGMHCVDCHFAQDSHGNGYLYGEVAHAIEIDCADCHGTPDNYPTLFTSGPAAPPGGHDLRLIRNPDGKPRFEWIGDRLIQRSLVNPGLEWEMSLVKDTVTAGHRDFNEKAARSKLMSRDTAKQNWGLDVAPADRAHDYSEMECYTCHTAWTTSCGGCHLPIEANWMTERYHYEGGISRNYATYNPQVARDEIFMIGRRGQVKGGKIAPIRSSSALVLSSTNANREKIYIQQPPIAASGYSSQAMNPHFAHTVRKTETKTCSDCHLAADGDNNAIVAQTLGLGTKYIDFLGYVAYMGTERGVESVQVTEWEEPQAVIGSYLHRYAYPDWYADHQANDRVLDTEHHYNRSRGSITCLQHRGEYLFTAGGRDGFRAYDIASIANKGVSHRILTAPFGPLGHRTHVPSKNATCVSISTTQPIAPSRNVGDLMRIDNEERPHHPIYYYALITDSEEGLIMVDIETLADGEPRNNFFERALTWNENGILDGARHITMGGTWAYIVADAGLVVLDLDEPLAPRLASVLPLNDGRASALQFRYLFVTDADGLKAVDVTRPEAPRLVADNTIPLRDARGVFVTRTFAYVAAAREGLVIVDVERPERMFEYARVTPEDGIVDARDVSIAHTNASLFAYVADGVGGLKVLQLTAPDTVPGFYGFSPDPKPELIASYPTSTPVLALTRALERDRFMDETGHQIAVFGRRGSGPLEIELVRRMYLNEDGTPWTVADDPVEDNPNQGSGRSALAQEAPQTRAAGEHDDDSAQPQKLSGGE